MPSKTKTRTPVAIDQFRGYQADFLGPDHKVTLPRMPRALQKELAPVASTGQHLLHYHNFSLVQHARRRFPVFTAANIDGKSFRKLPRHDDWQLDPRIDPNHQWGPDLYQANKSDFDRGHMTKREDVQWGQTDLEASNGAMSTFYYTNAVPQVPKLNQQLWRGLEDYILKGETISRGLRISLFTGPVLSDQDPVFITEVDGQQVQLPVLFWKVIYFTKSDGSLYRVGFLMGQEELLEQEGIVRPRIRSRDALLREEDQLFLDFKKAEVYQVNLRTIRKLTKLRFPVAAEPFKDSRSVKLILRQVQSRSVSAETPTVLIDGIRI